MKCRDCGQIQEAVGRVEGSLVELDGKVEAAVKEINKKVDKKVDAANRQTKKEIGDIKKGTQDIKKEVKDMKDNLFKVNKDVDEVKVMMTQMLEKLNMLELLNKLPSPTEGMLNRPREDILIAGGSGGPWSNSGKSAEVYSWEKNGWFEVSPMNEDHREASSFIYRDQLFVVGGGDNNAIETLNLNGLPSKWTKFHGELLYACDEHRTVVYQQSVVHIGGFNFDEGEWSNVISELQLTSPCTMKELFQMPEPRGHHGAEVFEDKVLILGGHNADQTTDSVLEFDPKKNECKEMPKLPFPLMRMATVRWRDEVVVLGGRDKNDEFLNGVFMYNSKTGKITTLPSMLEKRNGCCAVITGNIIVVMGGMSEKREYLSSVECFTMGSSTWEYLPAMNEPRSTAVAEVLPSTRKYV